ncbi:MAG: hypothetical protein EAZ44_00555 [Cytophagia bacterium]|nr:MAG: hypothetical protein EAY69_03905 [Cytophagales bacterium]TAG07271.1 MAG: hypothetical protein EAZ44_00555 [Cytophagia bacterium]TAG44500.1 MAG: hypothetical protein EAZ31_02095 [Cytophagia bacterium]TAH30740.1 MAG: hypothetical protein EAZ06_02135 [Cytophagales bacterium]
MYKRKIFIQLLLSFWLANIIIIVYFCNYSFIYPPKNWHEKKQIANVLLLTDYCLSTESRHTRHFLMPDYFAPFQDFPSYLEHFPSSSFFPVVIHQKRK